MKYPGIFGLIFIGYRSFCFHKRRIIFWQAERLSFPRISLLRSVRVSRNNVIQPELGPAPRGSVYRTGLDWLSETEPDFYPYDDMNRHFSYGLVVGIPAPYQRYSTANLIFTASPQ